MKTKRTLRILLGRGMRHFRQTLYWLLRALLALRYYDGQSSTRTQGKVWLFEDIYSSRGPRMLVEKLRFGSNWQLTSWNAWAIRRNPKGRIVCVRPVALNGAARHLGNGRAYRRLRELDPTPPERPSPPSGWRGGTCVGGLLWIEG